MYAIVASGGKQIKVAVGDVVVVEKLDAAVGESVTFDVIFLSDGDEITVDPSALADVTVTGEIVEQFKGEKAIVFKFKKRKGYKRLKGHRQRLTKVLITDVTGTDASKTAPKKAAPKKTAKSAEVVETTDEQVADVATSVAAIDEVVEATDKKTASRAKKAEAPKETEADDAQVAE